MTRLRPLLFRLGALVRARQRDRDIDDEITSHLAEATDEYVRQGLSPEDARRAARRSFLLDAGFGYGTMFAGAGTLHVIAFAVIVVAIRRIPDGRADAARPITHH